MDEESINIAAGLAYTKILYRNSAQNVDLSNNINCSRPSLTAKERWIMGWVSSVQSTYHRGNSSSPAHTMHPKCDKE